MFSLPLASAVSLLASTRLRPLPFYQALQPAAHLHTMLVATMQLSELGVRPLLAGTRQRHRYVHIRVCLFCTGIAALLYSYQALQLASCVMCAPQAPSAQLSYRDSPFSADVRRSVCLHLLMRSLTADQASDCSPAGALTACQPQGRTQKAHDTDMYTLEFAYFVLVLLLYSTRIRPRSWPAA